MSKKIIFIAIIVFVTISIIQCEEVGPTVRFLTIQNNSDMAIYTYLDDTYPDTFLTHQIASEVCQPHQTVTLLTHYSQTDIFDRNPIIQLFVMDVNDVMNFFKTDDDSVGYKFPYAHLELKRYELTREWLEQHDWTVTYP